MKLKHLALLTAVALAAMATPTFAAGYVNYSCGIDGYTFGIDRHGDDAATVKDATGAKVSVARKAVADGERYTAKDVDVWMKGNDAMITVNGAAHAGCTIARFAKPGAVNYVCATGYTFATHLGAKGLDYIDAFGNIASLAMADAKGAVRWQGTAVTGMTIDLSLAGGRASLSTNRGSNGLACQVK